jgi:hypothetical protein
MDPSELGLENKAAVIKEARKIAVHHLGGEVASAKECVQQGMFSRTIFVRMKNKLEYVVQLRVEDGHESNAKQAHDILGDIVPVPIRVVLPDSPVPFAYIMPFVRGSTWHRAAWASSNFHGHHVKVAERIGALIGTCCASLVNASPSTIDTFIIPRLQTYLEWDDPSIVPHKTLIAKLLSRADELRKLPLCWTHFDLNMVNVIVDEQTGEVQGVIDWEEAYWMPLGINTARLVYLAAWNRQGTLVPKPYSKEVENAFWKGLFNAAPAAAQSLLDELQLAMTIGMVMDTFFEAKNPPHPSHIGILEDALRTYRVPRDLRSLVTLQGFC